MDKIRLIIVTHFELGSFDNNLIGEAQLFYNKYFSNSEKILLKNGKEIYYNKKLRLILLVTGSGKVNTSSNLTCLFSDSKFDFSSAYVLNSGCAGGSLGFTNICDVIIESEVFDQDLGHTSDRLDLKLLGGETWFHDNSYDDVSYIKLNEELYRKVYDLTKNIELDTTSKTLNIMKNNYFDEYNGKFNPSIKIGACATGDNFWKGKYSHDRVNYIAKYYNTKYPYAVSEMEDIAVCVVCRQFGQLDRLISIRVCVNLDVFLGNSTPESLWSNSYDFNNVVKTENDETLDCFSIAMQNNFKVCDRVIQSIMNNDFSEVNL